ncbi:MAG: hypothetical protein LBJ11_07835 [Oscillospiraceae bacterium]|jgi:hypothetical protein|nr:hypothetical protein [Oscillospiraceae bacterium]
MNVELSPKAAKYLRGVNEPDKGRIQRALLKLAQEPPQGDMGILRT